MRASLQLESCLNFLKRLKSRKLRHLNHLGSLTMSTSITPSDQLYHMRRHFNSGATLSIPTRKKHLEMLRDTIKKHKDDIFAALKKDLGKHPFEAVGAEVAMVLEEIKFALEYLEEWTAPISVGTTLLAAPAQSTVYPQPRGVVLIISPWNYPFQLLFAPLVAAIAAGNCCALKPSELSPATTSITAKIVRDAFPSDVVVCYEGDAEVSTELLRHAWDHIFFTGSTRVGKIVAKAAAEHLTPVTLELGGKSPCIVDSSANIKQAAKRIVWGKFVNAGQTCIAPDYLLVHDSIKAPLIEAMKKYIRQFYGEDPMKSPYYGRIISFNHYERLAALITGGSAVHGGRRDRTEKYIEPTILDGVGLDHPTMAEEIFGPILPVLSWHEKGQIYTTLEANPHPLALYVFTKDQPFAKELIERVPFGGGCINQTLLHIASPEMPFGGIRQSGLGAYHGKTGFDAFTHYKSILKAGMLDNPIKYPPYSGWKTKLLNTVLG